MAKITFFSPEFKKMGDPYGDKDSKHTRYLCYVRANDMPRKLFDWMGTNPREQKMTTDVAKKIENSLLENNDFHELNRGIVLSAKTVEWNNKTKQLDVYFDDPEIHGNIDGGHTLNAILNNSKKLNEDRYVFMEIFTGIESPVELAAARNTSVQVDLKSREELERSFDAVKDVIADCSFCDRVEYKMNEGYGKDNKYIDVREVIAIIIMFSNDIYPLKDSLGSLNQLQPKQSYTGKETSLKKFLYHYRGQKGDKNENKEFRDKMLHSMQPIVKGIFELWEQVEISFADESNNAGRRFRGRKYANYVPHDSQKSELENNPYTSCFKLEPMNYTVPKGLMYPIVGAFRALVGIENGKYCWKKDPIAVWNKIGSNLIAIVLDEKAENPDVLGKNTNVWNNLLKEVFIEGIIGG